jgi:GNAT superfamily N-acetyltransferase
LAQSEDVDSWLSLAAEVENLFGAMVGEPCFVDALNRNIGRGSAFCIRECDGPPGTPLLAGILFSAKPPSYRIGWLAVAERSRRQGLGTAMLTHVMGLVEHPAEVAVTTFGPDVRDGEAARQFYLSAGFEPAEMTCEDPGGGSRQVFRKRVR